MRLLLVLIIGGIVCFAGVAVVEALHVESVGYFVVVIVAMFAASLADRERFYGIEPHK
ncbi:MAG: hypothetical protein AABM31_11640 [Actinomycetota bacterium]